ncbi:MAG: SRPBCC family protein [Candidatus Lernaella stagnicola]|nr:SRPBCC family protein [Candidatus Lernaella stagnicola]
MHEPIMLMLVLFLVCGFAAAAGAQDAQARTALNVEDINKATLAKLLKEGQLLKVKEDAGGRLELITGGILIDRPVEEVFRVVTDFPRFPEYMPSVEDCKVLSTEGDIKDVAFKVKFKFVISFNVEYVLRNRLNPPHEMTWNLVSSKGNKIKRSYGSWKLIALDGGKRTAAFYTVFSDFSDIIWGLERMLKKDPSMEVAINTSTVILVLKAVKKRSENPSWIQK